MVMMETECVDYSSSVSSCCSDSFSSCSEVGHLPDEVGRSSETGSDLPPSTGPSPSVCIALPEKLLLFWGEMANPSSPLKESHPLEYQMYQDLSTKPPSDLVRLGSAFDVGIADCLAAAGNRRPDVGATLLGRSLARFRTNNVIKNILLLARLGFSSTTVVWGSEFFRAAHQASSDEYGTACFVSTSAPSFKQRNGAVVVGRDRKRTLPMISGYSSRSCWKLLLSSEN